jgi:hypothetical protein
MTNIYAEFRTKTIPQINDIIEHYLVLGAFEEIEVAAEYGSYGQCICRYHEADCNEFFEDKLVEIIDRVNVWHDRIYIKKVY